VTQGPGELPDPPTDLHERSLPLAEITGPWFRSSRPGRGVIHFGRSGEGRFDDPARRFRVLYLAPSPQAAFIETIGGRAAVTSRELSDRVMSAVVSRRAARVVDLSGRHLTALGLDARVFAGAYRVSQRWSAAFHGHYEQPDGVLYRSRRDPSQLAIALYERDDWDFEVTPLPASTMASLADHYGLPVREAP